MTRETAGFVLQVLLSDINPLRRLRPRIALIVFAVVGCLALLVSLQSADRLTDVYEEAGRTQLNAIATTWDTTFRAADLRDPAALQRRVEQLQASNAQLHKISLSWHDERGRTLIVQAGHEHDPNGVKRDVTTSQVTKARGDVPIDEGARPYVEVRSAQAHFAEQNYPLVRRAEAAAMLELHYDLKSLDLALASDKQSLLGWALSLATVLALGLSLLLGRTVARPLDQIRAVANRLRRGESEARLDWKRSDEIGVLARDFDRMADALLEALKDPLTGLLNHRAFQERLEEELRRGEREKEPVSVVALDVDDFKVINDGLGHATGDDALRLMSAAIRSQLRVTDVCGRVGGDEFMLALPGADTAMAEEIVERIRETAARVEVGATGHSLTLSAGIATFPRHALSQEQLLRLADGAMYWAKSHGKNRTFLYSSAIDFALSAEEAAERNLRAGLINTVHALARAVDAKDGYTHMHSQRVARYAVTLAEGMGIDSEERLEMMRTAGVLHDVGKIGIPDSILMKADSFTEEEFEAMRRHSELGREIIAGAGMDGIAEWVRHLHERWDGGGYPDGLAGPDIPIESRILHVADALEAMTSSRVYRPGLPLTRAISELERGSGHQFDPVIAATLIELIKSGRLAILADEADLAAPALV
jgi:diguanylate cyclase (GGDEF)-like protein